MTDRDVEQSGFVIKKLVSDIYGVIGATNNMTIGTGISQENQLT